MKKYFFSASFSLLSIVNASGQQISAHPVSNKDAKDPTVISGFFDIDKKNEQTGIMQHANVNYMISPAPFNNILKLHLRTANPVLLTADIVDSKGNKLIHWEPAEKSYTYTDAIDISKLVSGNYKVNIYSEYNTTPHCISFQKKQD